MSDTWGWKRSIAGAAGGLATAILATQISWAQPPDAAAPPPKPPPEAGGSGGGDVEDQPAGPAADAGGAGPGASKGPGGADAAEDDSDDGFEEPYQAPMVDADYSKQPPGYDHELHRKHRWIFHDLFAVRVNPLGFTNRFRTGYRMQLSHRPEPVFFDSYGSVQLDTEITPAFGVVGARLEVQPAAMFNFFVSYGVVGSFGLFSYTRSFDSAQVAYSDSDLKDSRDQDYASVGHKSVVSGLFQFALGGVAVRDNFMAHYLNVDLEDGDNVFYDATLDVLVPNAGFVLTNDADLLILTEVNLKLGVRYTYTEALYRSEHLAGARNQNTPHHRFGPALLYTFFEDPPGTAWNKPTLVLLAQWWLRHRYRTTEKPALPYLVLGFVQEGDFLASDPE